MSYEAALDISLSAVLGDDPSLLAELRDALIESARGHVEALSAAKGPDSWADAALRLKNLAAGFGATGLMQAADAAHAAPCGDRDALGAIERHLVLIAL